MDDQERFTLQSLDGMVSFRPLAPEDADLHLFELVSRAVTERRGLIFQYRKPGEKNAGERRVHPYHLMEFGVQADSDGDEAVPARVVGSLLGVQQDRQF